MQKGCEEILVFDSDCRPKLLANLSNQDHIVRVGHGMNLRILSRPDPLFFFWSKNVDMCAHFWETFSVRAEQKTDGRRQKKCLDTLKTRINNFL